MGLLSREDTFWDGFLLHCSNGLNTRGFAFIIVLYRGTEEVGESRSHCHLQVPGTSKAF